MAQTKISALPSSTGAAANDQLVINDYNAGTYTTQAITYQKLTEAGGVTFESGAPAGRAIQLVAGEALSRGNIVCIKQTGGVDGQVFKVPITGNENEMPIGVVYADAALGAAVTVVVNGIAYVLPESTVTAARGNVLFTSTTEAGRATQSATGGATTAHWRECGHWLDTGSGAGALCRAILHFN